MLRKKNFLLIAFVIFLFSLGDLTAFSKTVRADNVHNIDPTSIASKNELSIKNIVGETAKVTEHSSNISDSNITSPNGIYTSFPSGSSEISVNIPGNSNNSNISSDTGLDGTTSITVTYGKDSDDGVGTYQGKPIYAVITYDNFKYNDSWKNSRNSAKIEFCQDLYGGVNFTMPLQSMEVKVKFFYKSDDSAVNLGTDSYLTIGSLNYHDATHDSADFKAAEFVTMKGGQYSDAYLTSADHTSVKAYGPNYTSNDNKIYDYAGTNPTYNSAYNGSIFAGVNYGTWATYKYDYLGSSNFADGAVTYKLNNQTEIDMRIGMLDYYQYTSNMWFSLSSESLWNAPPETPTKAVDDPSGNNVDYNGTFKELFAGTNIVYKIAQQVGDLGVDMMTPYTSFTYRDVLPDNVTFLGTGKIVAESSKGTEIKSWDFSTNSKDNSSVGTLSSTTTDRKTTDRKTTVNFAFTADFLSNPLNFNSSTNSHMVYDQRKYILELDCQINANAPTKTDIDNTATVGIDNYSNDTNQVTVRVNKYIPQTGSQRLLAIVILIIVLGIAIVVISKHRRAKE
ncbi:hypothetical protein A4W77_02325 [Latilactobacillus curvatus]|nr:hypothetical protein A4W77_02325 [Latilactobacillus curvatus]